MVMLSIKENLFETLKNGKPDAFVNEWEPFPQVWEPITSYMIPVAPGTPAAKNPWGVLLDWGKDEPGAMPIVTDETKVCPDITEWQKYVKAPDLTAVPMDWTQARADQEKFRAEGKLSMAWIFTGLFESLHHLMGFEDTLVNLLTEPDSVPELLD